MLLVCLVASVRLIAAQPAPINPPVIPGPGPANPPAPAPVQTAAVPPPQGASPAPAAPSGEAAPTPAASPCPTMVPVGPLGPTPVPCVPGYPTPVGAPTQPPIVVEPPAPGIAVGTTAILRVESALGTLTVTGFDPGIVTVTIDQTARTLSVYGKAVGTTTIRIADERGVTRDVPVRVAYPAGVVAPTISVRLTGDPATAGFIRGLVAQAVAEAARPRQGATVQVTPDVVNVKSNLDLDDVLAVDVPVIVEGAGYITVQGTTRVRVENFALPRISPSRLLVSDYPETLRENGTLFSARLTRDVAQRFLYYHYNPAGQPGRRILLKIENPAAQPALVQFISGTAGPESNEMDVGHLATRRFLVRELQNEGDVIFVPARTTLNLVDHPLPAGTTVSAILQLREVSGPDLTLTLLAQDANDPVDGPSAQNAALLNGDVPHARGIYPVPAFYFDYTYDTSQDPLDIPIGALKLPNEREGEALAGDYGVMQSITLTIVNRANAPAAVAIYENPRGGRATGTYLIDRVLVQSHAVPPYSHYKIRQYTVPARGFVRVQITTMPEGGSSYPLNLTVGPDDGSVAPGAPNSPVY